MKRYAVPLVILAAIGFPLSRTGAALVLREIPEKASLKNPLFEALGSAREALGDAIYIRADEYFHRGMDANLLHQIQEAGEDPSRPVFTPQTATEDWAMRINRKIKVVEHQHLNGDDAQEILPLLYASSTLNPQNLDAVLTAAYWLEKTTGDYRRALEVLQKALAAHPHEWKLQFAVAQILDTRQKNSAEAVPYYERAVRALTPENSMPFDGVRVRYAWAEALAAAGQNEKALVVYTETLGLAEQREKSALPGILRQKIAKLRSTSQSTTVMIPGMPAHAPEHQVEDLSE